MAHFAELDENNVVIRVTVVDNNDCLDENGKESEAVGAAFCHNLLGGRWIQTSYNGKFRKQYAGAGHIYNPDVDVFISLCPYKGWVLDSNFDWQPPVPKPEGNYYWSEDDMAWLADSAG